MVAGLRALLESRDKNVRRFQIVMNVPRPRRENLPETRLGDWMPMTGGGLVRIVHVPPDTDEETIERLLATP